MLRFDFHMPTRLVFGEGTLGELETMPEAAARKALIITANSDNTKASGVLSRVQKLLGQRGVETVVYDRVGYLAVMAQAEQGALVCIKEKCDLVVAVGGDSVLSVAKAVCIMVAEKKAFENLARYCSDNAATLKALPLVAIPTTAGSGSECASQFILNASDSREQIVCHSPSVFPVVSIVDPELALSLPLDDTALTGMDAFFRAVASYVSLRHQPASDLLALEIVGISTLHLPAVVRDPDNIRVRTALSWASAASGICRSIAPNWAHHALAQTLVTFYPSIPYGAALILLAPALLECMATRAPERFPDLAFAMGEHVDALPEKDQPYAFVTGLLRLITNIGLEQMTMKKFGVKESDLAAMTKHALETMGGQFANAPASMEESDILRILGNAHARTSPLCL